MNNKISIIVPIYNTGNCLGKCIESLINQTYKNIEIILVNDGSTDNSLDVCNHYKEKDNRILIINQKNNGVSYARNKGIEIATGDYLLFVDSDDYINLRLLEVLQKKLVEYNKIIDIINFGTLNVDLKGNKKLDSPKEEKLLSSEEAYILLNSYAGIGGGPCNKLFKKDLFKNIKFPIGKRCEDNYIIYKLILSSNKILTLPFTGYFYIKRENSFTTSNINNEYILAHKDQKDFIDKNYPTLSIYANTALFFAYVMRYNLYITRGKKVSDKMLKEIKSETQKLFSSVLKNKRLELKKKIQAIIFIYSKQIYNFFIKKRR